MMGKPGLTLTIGVWGFTVALGYWASINMDFTVVFSLPGTLGSCFISNGSSSFLLTFHANWLDITYVESEQGYVLLVSRSVTSGSTAPGPDYQKQERPKEYLLTEG